MLQCRVMQPYGFLAIQADQTSPSHSSTRVQVKFRRGPYQGRTKTIIAPNGTFVQKQYTDGVIRGPWSSHIALPLFPQKYLCFSNDPQLRNYPTLVA